MSRLSIGKTCVERRSSSVRKNSGAGSFNSLVHQPTTGEINCRSFISMVTSVHNTFRSEEPGREAPRAGEPYKITDSRFFPAASFSRLTSSVNFASIFSTRPRLIHAFDSFGSSLLDNSFYHLPPAPPPPLEPPPNPPNPPPPPPPQPPPPPPPPPPPLPPPLPSHHPAIPAAIFPIPEPPRPLPELPRP